MYVLRRLLAVYQGDDMRMMEAFEDRDFGGEVVLELFVEL